MVRPRALNLVHAFLLPLCELTTSREFYRPPRMRGGRITFHGSGISPLLKPAANPLEKIADTGHIGIGGGGIRRISVERPNDGEWYWKLRSKFHLQSRSLVTSEHCSAAVNSEGLRPLEIGRK